MFKLMSLLWFLYEKVTFCLKHCTVTCCITLPPSYQISFLVKHFIFQLLHTILIETTNKKFTCFLLKKINFLFYAGILNQNLQLYTFI